MIWTDLKNWRAAVSDLLGNQILLESWMKGTRLFDDVSMSLSTTRQDLTLLQPQPTTDQATTTGYVNSKLECTFNLFVSISWVIIFSLFGAAVPSLVEPNPPINRAINMVEPWLCRSRKRQFLGWKPTELKKFAVVIQLKPIDSEGFRLDGSSTTVIWLSSLCFAVPTRSEIESLINSIMKRFVCKWWSENPKRN